MSASCASRSAPSDEVVTVQSTGTVVETTNSDYSGLLTAKQISQIQTKGRDVVNLLRCCPGALRERHRGDGRSFGSQIPNIDGSAAPGIR
jgi:hypothetical protein